MAWSDDNFGWREYGRDGEAHVSIQRWPGPAPVPPRDGGATIVLSVDNAHKTVEALRAMGVKCNDAVTITGVVTYATFFDPEGNRIQFAASEPPPT